LDGAVAGLELDLDALGLYRALLLNMERRAASVVVVGVVVVVVVVVVSLDFSTSSAPMSKFLPFGGTSLLTSGSSLLLLTRGSSLLPTGLSKGSSRESGSKSSTLVSHASCSHSVQICLQAACPSSHSILQNTPKA